MTSNLLTRAALRRAVVCAFAGLGLCALSAQAHVVLEQPSATAGSYYKAVLMVGHGCEGGQATHTVTVRLPAGFNGAKSMPKPGWAISSVRETLVQPWVSHGKTITDAVTEITWVAQTPEAALPDAQYDEFVLRGQLPETAGPLWFKVKQLCANGVLDWSELPASGTVTKGLKSPAVLLQVEPADGHAHH
ncbi:MAG: YcnI family protein [Leptothrix sp. (in: b-proteobacteria)]